MQSAPAPPRKVVLAVVTTTDDISLACTTSLLRLQQLAARRNVALDVHVVGSFLEALNTHEHGDFVVAMDAACGVPPEFVFGLLDSKDHPVIAGVYPLAKVDWDRVGRVLADPLATEPLSHAGNVYNVTPSPGPGLHRYVPIKDVSELRVLGVSSAILAAMAGPHLSYTDSDGNDKTLFAYESVLDGAYQNPWQTFARLLGSTPIVADLEAPCVFAAPAQFAGCVGMRSVLR